MKKTKLATLMLIAATSNAMAATAWKAQIELNFDKTVKENNFDFMYRYDYRIAGAIYRDANDEEFMVIAKMYMDEDFARSVKFQISSSHEICEGTPHDELIKINGRNFKSSMTCGYGGRSAYFTLKTSEANRVVPNSMSFFNTTTFSYHGYTFEIPTKNFDKAWDALGGNAL